MLTALAKEKGGKTQTVNSDYERFQRLLSSFDPVLLELEGINSQKDLYSYMEHFFNSGVISASIDVNANVRSTNIYTFFSEFPKIYLKELSLFLIWKCLKELFGLDVADEFIKQEITGGIYTHDLFHAAFIPYCYAYSLGEIVRNGLQFIENIKSSPAKHLNTFIQHVIQFVMFASNQSSGAVGLPDLFVWMWYYVKKDLETGYIPKDNWQEHVKQAFQVFTYSINQPIRGTQSPYVNVTYLDREYIKSIFKDETYPDGTKIIDELENIIMLQKMYWQWISDEREKQMFTFPVMTASLLFKNCNFLDEDSARFINKVNMKWQDTNLYLADSVDAVASCCRLQSSTKQIKLSLMPNKLAGMANSIGGSDLNIGSFKVITINLPRISLETNGDIQQFFEILRKRLDLTMKALKAVRSLIEDRINKGLLPLYTFRLMNLDRQYGTIGITGVWEAASLIDGLTTKLVDGYQYTNDGIEFVDKVLNTISEETEEGRYIYGFTFNIEQVPAEKAAVTLAEKDRYLFNQPFNIYSNQWIPLNVNTNMINRIYYSSLFDSKVNGGAILHLNIDGQITDEEYSFQLIKQIAESNVKYFTFNTKISVCEENHAFYGNVCPICGKPVVDYFTRIVGYLVPSKAFNKVRKEHDLIYRQFYEVSTTN